MILNYLKIAWRNLLRQKGYSLINILGLSAGMAIVLLISLWIKDELTFNRSFPNYGRLARVMQNSTHKNTVNSYTSLPIPLSTELRAKYASDLKKVAMTSYNDVHTLANGDKRLNKAGLFAQPDLAGMLSLVMLSGSRESLAGPSSILISRSLARALFGGEDALGRMIRVDNNRSMAVGGVFEDFPDNSEFRETSFLGSWEFYMVDQRVLRKNLETDWANNGEQLFVQLQDHSDPATVTARVRALLGGHGRKNKPELFIHPMSRWHLYEEFRNGTNTGGSIQLVWMFGIIGVFVLLLACINFMNLSTARSETRAKEVGVRKAVGSLRQQLILQFLGESVLLSAVSFAVALLLCWVSLPGFDRLADKQLSMPWGQGWFWLPAIAFTLFTGLLAGSYPAFYFSSFDAVQVLKGTFRTGRWAAIPRQLLTVLQFSVSIALMIGTVIVYEQIVYARQRSAGYSRDGLLTVNTNTADLQQHYAAIRNDLLASGAVTGVGESSTNMTSINLTQSSFNWTGKDPAVLPSFVVVFVSHDFGQAVGWQLSQGRDFSRDLASDSAGILLNEAAVRYMGLRHPVGETVQVLRSKRADQRYRVIGVVKDLVMESPYAPVQPTLFLIDYSQTNTCFVKVNPAYTMAEALPRIEAVFKRYSPGSPWDYRFTDLDYAKKFEMEIRMGHLAGLFSAFAIFISCLGLWGLASFMAARRAKEIGIRKLLGASVTQLWVRLSVGFFLPVLVSFFIAAPLSGYIMHNWLQQYEYRVGIPVSVFGITLLLALVIAVLTVSYQTIRTARANPVESLRMK